MLLLSVTTELLVSPADLPILPPIFAALFVLTIFLDLCVFVFLLTTDTFGVPILLAIVRLFDVVTLLFLLTLTFVFRIALCCVRMLVLGLRTVDRVTVGVERLTETLGRLVVLCVLMFVDAGVLVFTDLFVLTVLLFAFLILVCGCIVVLLFLILLLLTFVCLVDLLDATLLLLTFDCLAICAGLELNDELLFAVREELFVALCVALLCLWLLLCEERLLFPLDFPASFAKVLSAKTNTISIVITEEYLIIFVFFLANIILLLYFLSSSITSSFIF